MDPDEISRLVEDLKLTTEREENIVDLGPSITINRDINGGLLLEKSVMEKIFYSRVVNRMTLLTQLPYILQTRVCPKIEIVGDTIFVVIFANDNERRHALCGGPWHFFDKLMVFKEPVGMQKPSDVKFEEYTTWIQIFNLPLACMTPQIVRKVAGVVGFVEEVAVGEGGLCLGQYARARVTRQIEKPLQRLVRLNTGEGCEAQYVLIKYEKLHEFCTACGRVGHALSYCTNKSVNKNEVKYDEWLRAERTNETRRGRGGAQASNKTRNGKNSVPMNAGKEVQDSTDKEEGNEMTIWEEIVETER